MLPSIPSVASLHALHEQSVDSAVENPGYVVWSRLQRISRTVPLIYPKPDAALSAKSDPKLAQSESDLPTKPQKSYVIPPGTPVSMLIMALHDNPEKFPEPAKWDPERWLIRTNGERPGSERKVTFNNALLRYIAPFTRGTRSCLGKELAQAEIYLVLARLFGGESGINLRICDDLSDERDVTADHGGFTTAPPRGRGGLWVKVERS